MLGSYSTEWNWFEISFKVALNARPGGKRRSQAAVAQPRRSCQRSVSSRLRGGPEGARPGCAALSRASGRSTADSGRALPACAVVLTCLWLLRSGCSPGKQGESGGSHSWDPSAGPARVAPHGAQPLGPSPLLEHVCLLALFFGNRSCLLVLLNAGSLFPIPNSHNCWAFVGRIAQIPAKTLDSGHHSVPHFPSRLLAVQRDNCRECFLNFCRRELGTLS